MTNPACFDDQYHVFLMSGGHNHKPVEMTGNTGTGKSKIKNEGGSALNNITRSWRKQRLK